MFTRKETIRIAVANLLAATATTNRGDVLKWEIIEQITQVQRYTESWNTIIKKYRREVLQERKIAMRPVVSVGLEFLTESDQVKRCARDRQRKMFRQSTMAIRELKAVDPTKLTDHERKMQTMQIKYLKDERSAIKQSIKSMPTVSPTNPVRPLLKHI